MREYRSITFSEVELIRAVVERRQQHRQQLPYGTIQGAVPVTEADGTSLRAITLSVESDAGERHALQVSPEETAAALIHYCLQRRVPIPKAASKWVDVIDGEVALFMDIEAVMDMTRPRSRTGTQERSGARS